MVFTTDGFFEVAIECWPEWDLYIYYTHIHIYIHIIYILYTIHIYIHIIYIYHIHVIYIPE